MQDREKINKIHDLIAQGEYPQARKILESITTKDPSIRVDVLLLFLTVLDHVSENDKLLEVANEGIEITTQTNNESVRNYFMGQKTIFLIANLSQIIYRQKNLMLSAGVFEWIDFSLETDKKEFALILEKRKKLETEIQDLLAKVIERAECGKDPYFRGSLFAEIGDFYSSKYLCDMLDFQNGGKMKSKIANMYFVRRWNLIKFLYNRSSRRRIQDSKRKCILYFERAIKEFKLGGKKSEEAYATYNLAVKLKLFNHFRKANNFLVKAKVIAEELKDKPMLAKIEMLKKETADKNRHLRDYVSELGLDMP